MIFNRQLYKQKPSAWGPVSNVQTSIFKNAERIGIDPVLTAIYIPFWERAGLHINNYGIYSGNGTAVPDVTWKNNALETIAYTGSSNIITMSRPTENIISLTTPFTLYFRAFVSDFIGWDYPGIVKIKCSDGQEFRAGFGNIVNYQGVICGSSANWVTIETNESGFAGAWHNVFIIYNGRGSGDIANFKIIRNNIQRSTSTAGTFGVNIDETSIGPSNGVNQNFNGLIDHIWFLKTALNDSQVAHLSDNPYYLLHRVAPVFYSVPGGADSVTILSTTGTVVVTGYNVGIETGVTISVNTGTITGTGFNVEVEQGTSVQVTTGEISINGLNPDIVQSTQFIVTQGMVAINSFDTTVLNGTEINVTSKNVSITGYVVEVEQGIIITSSVESVVVTGYNVSVTNELIISLNFGSVIIAGYNTTVLAGTRIDLTKAEITITGLDLEIEQGTQIDVTSETITVTGLDVSVENALSINVTTGSVNVLGYPASVYAGILVEATTGNVAITGYNPTVAQSSGIEVTTGQVTITGLDTTIECTVLIEPTTGMVIIASYEVTVSDGLVAETPITRTNVVAASNRVITNSGSSRLIVIT